jgi:uridine kinase
VDSDEVIQKTIRDRRLVLIATGLDDQRATQEIVNLLCRTRRKETTVISLIGGAASGKSTLAKSIAEVLKSTAIISTDDFLLGSRAYRRKYLEGGDPLDKYGFDLLREKVNQITNLRFGESVGVPVYHEENGAGIRIIDFDSETGQIISIDKNHCQRWVGKVEFLIIEGDFQPLADPDHQIFLHVPDRIRLRNRIARDAKQRDAVRIEETVSNFELRQTLQHRPFTLACANRADILVIVSANEIDAGYEYMYSLWVCPSEPQLICGSDSSIV